MSYPFYPDNVRELLNNMCPSSARAKLGDIIVDLQNKAAGSGDPELASTVADLQSAVSGLTNRISDLETQASDFESRIAALETTAEA